METRSQKRKREIQSTRIAQQSAENIKSRKIREVSIKLLRLTPDQLLDATTNHKSDQQKLTSKISCQSTSVVDNGPENHRHGTSTTTEMKNSFRKQVNF